MENKNGDDKARRGFIFVLFFGGEGAFWGRNSSVRKGRKERGFLSFLLALHFLEAFTISNDLYCLNDEVLTRVDL